jgi:hypothetical protein
VLEPDTVVVALEVTLVMVERLPVVLEAPVVLLVPPYQVPVEAAVLKGGLVKNKFGCTYVHIFFYID